MSRRLLLLPLLLAAAALPDAAHAATLTTYEVVMEGRIATDHRAQIGDPSFVASKMEGRAEVDFVARIPGVRFLDGEPYGIAIPQVVTSGPLETVRPDVFWQRRWVECADGCERRESECTWAGLDHPERFGVVQTSAGAPGAVSMSVGIASGALVARMACKGDLYGRGADHHFHLEPEGTPVQATFALAKATIGDAVIERPYRLDASGDDCPNRSIDTVFCSYDVRGVVTMRRTAVEERPDEQPKPPRPTAPVGPTGPAGPTPATPPAGPAGPVAPPAVQSGRIKKPYSAYEVAIRCKRVGCRGTVKAYPKAKPSRSRSRTRPRGRASAARRPLATARFDAPTADHATARLRFDAADRQAIRRAGGLRLVIEAEGAPAVTRTVAVAKD